MTTPYFPNSYQDAAWTVQRPVGTDGRRRPHGARQDDRLDGVDREVEEIGRFLHGIRAVGDDDTVHVFPVGDFLDTAGQGLT